MTVPIKKSLLPNGLELIQFRLKNGVRVYFVEERSAPVFSFQAWFQVGSKHEKRDPRLQKTGLAHLFEHMMFRGTPRFPDGAFDRVLAEAGVHDENATTWFDRTQYYESLPKESFELLLDLESDRIQNLNLTEALLETEKNAVLGELRMGKDNPDLVGSELLYETAIQDHPYRYSPIGTEEEIKGFTLEEAQYFYRHYYSGETLTLFIVGDLSLEEVEDSCERFFGGLQKKSEIPELLQRDDDDKWKASARATESNDKGKTHSNTHSMTQGSPGPIVRYRHAQLEQWKLWWSYPAPAVTHPDHPALSVLQAALTMGETSILEKRWIASNRAVSVDAWVDQFEDPGLFGLVLDFEEPSEKMEATLLKGFLDDFDHALQVWKSELLAVDKEGENQELKRARSQVLLSISRNWEDHASIASFLGEFIASAGAAEFAVEWLNRVKAVTAQDIVRVIEDYFVSQKRVVVLGVPGEAGIHHES